MIHERNPIHTYPPALDLSLAYLRIATAHVSIPPQCICVTTVPSAVMLNVYTSSARSVDQTAKSTSLSMFFHVQRTMYFFFFLELKTSSDKSLCIGSFVAKQSVHGERKENATRREKVQREMETGDETWPSHKNNLRKQRMYVKSYAMCLQNRGKIGDKMDLSWEVYLRCGAVQWWCVTRAGIKIKIVRRMWRRR